MKIVGLIFFVVLIVFASGCLQSQQPAVPTVPQNNTSNQKVFSVDIKDFAFNPASLEINVGDTVTWTNNDSAPHNVVSVSRKELSSAILSKGQTFSHTFTATGTFEYLCTIHPNMKAAIIVK